MKLARVSRIASAAAGVLLFAVLVWFAGGQDIDLSQVDLNYALACVGVYAVMLCLRALNFRLISGVPKKQGMMWHWYRLAACHQLIFLIAPSGSGDLTFPAMARKFVGVDLANAAGVIVLSRIRDALAIIGLGATGLAFSGIHALIFATVAVLALAVLFWTETAIRLAIELISLAWPKNSRLQNFLMKLSDAARISMDHQAQRNVVTLAIWLCAGAGVWFGFSAAGYRLTLWECWVIVLFLNVAGALAVSIAGIGFAEAGAAGALMLFGASGPEAAELAVVARPLMLISLIVAACLLERVSYFANRSGPPAP